MTRATKRISLLPLLLLALLLPQHAFATKDADKSMTASALSQTEKFFDAFEETAKAWKKAAPGSPEAETLAQKGEGELAALEAHFNKQLPVFEEREKWYLAQGREYAEGQEFMDARIKRLKRFMDKARNLDLYRKLRP